MRRKEQNYGKRNNAKWGGTLSSDTWEVLDFTPTESSYVCRVPTTRTTNPTFVMVFTDDIESIEPPSSGRLGVAGYRVVISSVISAGTYYKKTDGAIGSYGSFGASIQNGTLQLVFQGDGPKFIVGRTYHLVYNKGE